MADKKIQDKASINKPIFHRFKKSVGKGGFAYRGVREKHQVEDYLLAGIDHRPQPSPWFESEKAFFTSLLLNQNFDIFVVPFQTQLDGVDATGRLLMSCQLAAEIESRTNMRVAPIPVVHLALGSHARYYDDSEIYKLANRIGVSQIVWGFAGIREDEAGHVESLDISIIHKSK